MKTLRNHKLFIDGNCPLCKAYSQGFVKFGMLDSNSIQNYGTAPDSYFQFIDLHRSKNEIALLDPVTNQVSYGVYSLLSIIFYSFPMLKFLEKSKAVMYLLKKAYNLISYNRKVVVPAGQCDVKGRICTPDFNLKYRWFFKGVIECCFKRMSILFLERN